MNESEYVYVPKDVAAQLKKLYAQDSYSTRLTPEITHSVISRLIDHEKQCIKDDLAGVDEDVKRYQNLLLTYRHEFKEALTTHRDGMTATLEQIDVELPSVIKHATQVATTISDEVAKPLKECLQTIKDLDRVLNSINEHKLTKMLDIIHQLQAIDERTATILLKVLTLYITE
jgi:hypothetical protein